MFKAKPMCNGFIREARGADAGLVLNYLEKVCTETDFLTFGAGEWNLSKEDEHDFLETCHLRDNSIYLLAMSKKKLVGTLSFHGGSRPRTRHAGEFGMSILKSHWGQGVGSALLDTLIEWCQRGDIIKKINLRVRTDNDRAMRLYQKKGFQEEGTMKHELKVGDQFFDFLWMGLILE